MAALKKRTTKKKLPTYFKPLQSEPVVSRFAGVNSLVSFCLVLYVAEAQHSGVFPASASQKEGVSLIPAIAVDEPFFKNLSHKVRLAG